MSGRGIPIRGARPGGVETVELFVRDVLSSRVTPVRELAGFSRLELDAGLAGVATVPLAVEDVGVMGDDGDRTPEAGTTGCSRAT